MAAQAPPAVHVADFSAINWSSQPAALYPRHGISIRLSNNNTVGQRVNPGRTWDNGVVMTAEAVPVGTMLQITVLEKVEKWSGSLCIALTTDSPENCTVLSALHMMFNQSKKEYWYLSGNRIWHNGQDKAISIDMDDLRVQQSVGLLVSRDGVLHLFVDGKHRERVWSGLPTDQPLWGVADVCRNCTEIKADILCEVREETRQRDTKARLSLQLTQQELSHEREASAQLRQQVAQNENIVQQLLSDTGHQIAQLRQENEAQIQEKDVQIQHLKGQVQHLQQSLTETTQQLSDVGREKDAQIRQLQQQLSVTRRENEVQVHQLRQTLSQKLSDLRREKDAQIQHLQQRLGTTLSCTHSQEIEFWRVSPEEVQVDQEVIGRGAWGYVSRGTFRGQQVAVKMVYPDILKPHTVDRIRREISTMAQVRHPNLVLFIAAVLDDRTGPMIITEILDASLRTVYEENRLGSNKLRVLRDVASALNYLHLHRQPIIHRDVSSANVLLEAVANDVWKAKLSDFGSANLVRFSTTPGEGAIIYTAPEAFPQHPRSRTPPPPQTPKIDVYSYGVLVGEVVILELPDPDRLQEMVQQVWRQWPQIHPLVTSSIEYSPNDRPTMAYILEELEKLTP